MDKTQLLIAADFLEENGFAGPAKELRRHAGTIHLAIVPPAEFRGDRWETIVQIGVERDAVVIHAGDWLVSPLFIPVDGNTLVLSMLPKMD